MTPIDRRDIGVPMQTVSQLLLALIERFGSEAKAARAVGVAQPTLNEAKKKGSVGPRLAMGIDRATGGEISKSDLRPDLWPRVEGDAA